MSGISLNNPVFHVTDVTDVAIPGLLLLSGGFNVKIITVMPIQDKGPVPALPHYTEAHTTVSHPNWVTRHITTDNGLVLCAVGPWEKQR